MSPSNIISSKTTHPINFWLGLLEQTIFGTIYEKNDMFGFAEPLKLGVFCVFSPNSKTWDIIEYNSAVSDPIYT